MSNRTTMTMEQFTEQFGCSCDCHWGDCSSCQSLECEGCELCSCDCSQESN